MQTGFFYPTTVPSFTVADMWHFFECDADMCGVNFKMKRSFTGADERPWSKDCEVGFEYSIYYCTVVRVCFSFSFFFFFLKMVQPAEERLTKLI